AGAVARRIVDVDRRRQLARAEPFAGLDGVDLGDGDDVAAARFAQLLGLFALDLEQRTHARVLAPGGLEVRAFADRAAKDARHRQAADRAVNDLEHVHGRVGDSEPIRGRLRSGRFVAHRLQQSAYAPRAGRAAEQ